MDPRKKHPLQDRDLYTPMNGEILDLLERMRMAYGTWRKVCEVSHTRPKVLRNVRKRRKAVSLRLLDRLCSTTGIGRVGDFVWFTAEDIEKLGVWKPTLGVAGRQRYHDGKEWTMEIGTATRKRREKEREKRRLKRLGPDYKEFGIPIPGLPDDWYKERPPS